MSTTNPSELSEVSQMITDVQARLDQIAARVAELLGEPTATPAVDGRDFDRVQAVGEVAHRHLSFIEEHGSMTLGDSLAIRRELYPNNVRSTANLFGKKGSGALFYRVDGHEVARRDDQTVDLTDDGRRIAELWRDTHR